MSHMNVERVIGVLATDGSARGRFVRNPAGFLAELMQNGMELNECERWSLARLNPEELARFAGTIDPRLQKADSGQGEAHER